MTDLPWLCHWYIAAIVCCKVARTGLFSPDSISLRTTVISVSRSLRAIRLLSIASACQPRYQRSVSSLAEKLAK